MAWVKASKPHIEAKSPLDLEISVCVPSPSFASLLADGDAQSGDLQWVPCSHHIVLHEHWEIVEFGMFLHTQCRQGSWNRFKGWNLGEIGGFWISISNLRVERDQVMVLVARWNLNMFPTPHWSNNLIVPWSYHYTINIQQQKMLTNPWWPWPTCKETQETCIKHVKDLE